MKPDRKEKEGSVTELIELCVDSRRAGDRTHQPGLQEGGPTVDQAPLPPDVILREGEETEGGQGGGGGGEERGRRGSTKRRKQTVMLFTIFLQKLIKYEALDFMYSFKHFRVPGVVHIHKHYCKCASLAVVAHF